MNHNKLTGHVFIEKNTARHQTATMLKSKELKDMFARETIGESWVIGYI